MFDSTELLKLAGAEAGGEVFGVRLRRSWVRPLTLAFLALVWVVLLAAVLNSSGASLTPAYLNFVGLSVIGIVMLLVALSVVSYLVWTRYDLTTEAVEVDPGGRMFHRIGVAEVEAIERYGWFVWLASGGRVSHLRLRLKKSGETVWLKDLCAAELVEQCILARREKLLLVAGRAVPGIGGDGN